jgi:heme o synthase
VVEPSGRATAQRILAYSLILIPVSMVPTFMGMAGRVYLGGAVVLGVLLFCVGLRLTLLKRPIASGISKMRARQLLQATIVYLPVLFVIMMMNSK